jgi:hypothetical protein
MECIMDLELIVMLTHHDKTVENAADLFVELKDLPITHWGFKDVGLPMEKMQNLVALMKQAGKTTYLEVVSLSEAEGLKGAELAVKGGFDVLMGTVYFSSIKNSLRGTSVKYFPFAGQVFGHPSVLDGSIDQIVQHSRSLEEQGVDGLDLLAYRYTGDARRLLCEVVQATNIPIVCAGSVASFERIKEISDCGAWSYTIGSAFFEEKFVPEGGFRANLMAVWNWMHKKEHVPS